MNRSLFSLLSFVIARSIATRQSSITNNKQDGLLRSASLRLHLTQ